MKKILVVVLFVITACNSSKQVSQTISTAPVNITIAGKIFATLFQQKSAEYKALCLQAFNIARLRIDESMQTASIKPRAIITDIDETILDNSAYEVHQTLQGKDYLAASWLQWINMSNADTVPGAASFLKYAASKGITIFYITNRQEKEKQGTLLNLQKFVSKQLV